MGNVPGDPVGEIATAELWAGDMAAMQELQQKWVTALFVQFRFLDGDDRYQSAILNDCLARLEQIVGGCHGDVVALSHDAALALFSGTGYPHEHIQNAVEAATRLREAVQALNAQRCSRNHSALRMGIGIDGGLLAASGYNRHPCLDPGLQIYLSKARRLSELNYQTPFPAIFVSPPVANGIQSDRYYAIQNLGSVAVEKHPDPLTVYAVIDC